MVAAAAAAAATDLGKLRKKSGRLGVSHSEPDVTITAEPDVTITASLTAR